MNVLEQIMKSTIRTTKQQNRDRMEILRANRLQRQEVCERIAKELAFLVTNYSGEVEVSEYGHVMVTYPKKDGHRYHAKLKLVHTYKDILGSEECLCDTESKYVLVNWNPNMYHGTKDDKLTLEQFVEKLAKKMVE